METLGRVFTWLSWLSGVVLGGERWRAREGFTFECGEGTEMEGNLCRGKEFLSLEEAVECGEICTHSRKHAKGVHSEADRRFGWV